MSPELLRKNLLRNSSDVRKSMQRRKKLQEALSTGDQRLPPREEANLSVFLCSKKFSKKTGHFRGMAASYILLYERPFSSLERGPRSLVACCYLLMNKHGSDPCSKRMVRAGSRDRHPLCQPRSVGPERASGREKNRILRCIRTHLC